MRSRLAWYVGTLGALVALAAHVEAAQGRAAATGVIATSFGSFTVDAVEVADQFPPGCGKPAPGCSPAKAGSKVLMVWLKSKGDPGDAASGLMSLSGVYVKSDDGKRTDSFSGGMMSQRLFVAFTPEAASKGFVLHWGDNPPISLGK